MDVKGRKILLLISACFQLLQQINGKKFKSERFSVVIQGLPCVLVTSYLIFSIYNIPPFFLNQIRNCKQTYPEIVPLSALIACNAMNCPRGTAIYFSHKFHH